MATVNETINFPRDTSLLKIVDQLAETNVYLKSIASDKTFDIGTIDTVKDISESGLATRYFSEGDQIVIQYTTTDGKVYSMPWDMCLGRTATLADGSSREVIYLKSHYATVESIQFDAAETEAATEGTATDGLYYYGYDGTNYTLLDLAAGGTVPYSSYTAVYHNAIKDTTCNILRYGYNRYSHSAIHQWLNSSADKGKWWTAQHVGDVAPSQLNSYRGFLACLPEDFANAAETIQVAQALNTVSEPDKTIGTETVKAKFFLPSLEQMYINPQASGVEGEYWDYYKQLAEGAGFTGRYPWYTNNTAFQHYALENQSSDQSVRLRSANRSYSYYTWHVYSSGYVSYGSGGAFNSFRACPACAI